MNKKYFSQSLVVILEPFERTLDDDETLVGEENHQISRTHPGHVAHVQDELADEIASIDNMHDFECLKRGHDVLEHVRGEKERVGNGQRQHVQFGRRERAVDLHAWTIAIA